jgi:DNA-binding response OmpR family regulator
MRYAAEVIDLLSSAPGQPFKKRHIVNHIARDDKQHRRFIRVGVWRVLKVLEESKQVEVTTSEVRGSSALYSWRDT